MAPPPTQVLQWLKRTYPRPTVDPEWLQGCYTWIEQELPHLNTARDMPIILENVNTQLLQSNFADSMVAGTGFPPNVLNAEKVFLEGPILVEIVEIMEIGHSAYSLLQTYESRQEYRKQADLRAAGGDADAEEQKPMPKYPRSMLQLELSDGVSTLPAIESKKLPEFELGETPLGCKMIIKNVWIRQGTALLKPDCIELKGHQTADRDEQRDATFLRALKKRLG
ncbi:hypothetical protein C8Q79DRAFT_493110 [Trametes meyenii]|nr:hypothetical protein C8Q79DRAFT_493110 [Trametes meyenii]